MSEIKFKSQICTTREQSERLISLGLKKETADMTWFRRSKNADWESSTTSYKEWVEEILPIVDDYMLEDIIPAWSLHRLIEMMPKCIAIDGDSAYPLQITKRYDGQWVVGYQGWYDSVGGLYDNIIFIYQLLISEGYIDEEFCNKG